jgi:hypothetical protein
MFIQEKQNPKKIAHVRSGWNHMENTLQAGD